MSISEKLTKVAENVPKVYEAGKKDEHAKFWDAYQNAENGVPKRTSYLSGFQGNMGWTKDNFYPKYDIKPVGNATQLFYAWEDEDKHTMDLSARLKECGVVLDTSQATSLQSAFAYVRFASIPPIDVTGLTSNSALVFGDNHDRLKTIEKIIIAETTPIGSNWFRNDKGLTNLTIEGTIGQNGFSVKDCTKLTVASLLSILTALSKDKSIASGKSITFADNHLAVVQADEDCLEQLSSALIAGWGIFFGTTKYEG